MPASLRRIAVATSLAALSIAGIVSCASDFAVQPDNTGKEGNACYANGTCNSGLQCLSNLCVGFAAEAGAPDQVLEASVQATGGDAATDAGDASSSDDGTGCGAIPILHEAGAGPYCPFQAMGASPDCAGTQHCCNYTGVSQTAQCVLLGAQCPAAMAPGALHDWVCDNDSQCSTGNVCCATPLAFTSVTVTQDPMCSAQRLKGQNVDGTVCATTCANGGLRLCGSDADCQGSTHCVPFSVLGRSVGTCR